ncbi:MAG: glycine--tRNA ligase subunit beta [Phenylobacterium sp.]|jgi:glycyl-tRNA synthetase beta chain|uniref:glycine--tRNA ligase subunit beta n=1 Tax=Phenylobacterium sp. TaxID=1871053 RepID=UPI002A365276|nr:glycine--tRNA ligase subunit beta [Phenylobacterium sp.]MDX9997085.1 glycine--tRNA ligase subunit beta [Phenylobacterium sp.]
MPQLLLELFSEEIPARMQAQAARDLERMARDRLAAEGLIPEAAKAFAGPRRLTLCAEGLPAAQPDRREERKGPRVGAPEQALAGFLRSAGVTREQLVERDGVFFATIERKGRPTAEIVAAMVEDIIRDFPWPKSMTWGTGTLRWVRPLKRILCVFDGEVVPFDVDGIVSGDLTEGHRFMGSGQPFAVRDFESYEEGLRKNFVLLDPQERKDKILEGARTLCFARNLELVEDAGLLDEVSGLVEWPVPVLGDMDPAFLDLPPEVIRTSMRTHQKYFAVRKSGSEELAPHFVTVANIAAPDGGKAIAAGNARVLSARLNDARFFWDEDRKVTLEQRLQKLHGVTFHARLGTLAERVERLEMLAREIAPKVGADVDKAVQAARLAKADLATGTVGEFPELQGVMGGYYASEEGLSRVVADAIRDHYRPLGPSDEAPDTPVTMAVALADKVDTLAGFFAIGEKPTGSRDPYALRRAALGLIRIILQSEVRAPVHDLVEAWYRSLKCFVDPGRALFVSTPKTTAYLGARARAPSREFNVYLGEFEAALLEDAPVVVEMDEEVDLQFDRGSRGDAKPEGRVLYEFRAYREVAAEVRAFLADRLKVQLREEGRRHDLVDAVFALGDDDLVRIVARVEALDRFLGTEDGANLLAGYKRATNILRAEEKKGPLPTGEARPMSSSPAEERALIAALEAAEPQVAAALEAEDFAAAMRALAGLRAPVDSFFDKVLVNSEDAAERDNRLRLLAQVRAATGRVADFGQVTG